MNCSFEEFTAAIQQVDREKEERLHSLNTAFLQALQAQTINQQEQLKQLRIENVEMKRALLDQKHTFDETVELLNRQNGERTKSLLDALELTSARDKNLQETIKTLQADATLMRNRMDTLQNDTLLQISSLNESFMSARLEVVSDVKNIESKLNGQLHLALEEIAVPLKGMESECKDLLSKQLDLNYKFEEFSINNNIAEVESETQRHDIDEIKQSLKTMSDELEIVKVSLEESDGDRQQTNFTEAEISDLVNDTLRLHDEQLSEGFEQYKTEDEQRQDENLRKSMALIEENLQTAMDKFTMQIMYEVEQMAISRQNYPVQVETRDAYTMAADSSSDMMRKEVQELTNENLSLKEMIRTMREAIMKQDGSTVADFQSDRDHEIPAEKVDILEEVPKIRMKEELLRLKSENGKLTAFSNQLQAQLKFLKHKPKSERSTQTRHRYVPLLSDQQQPVKLLSSENRHNTMPLSELKPQKLVSKKEHRLSVRNWNSRDD